MLIFRWIVLLLGVGSCVCFAMFVGTGQPRWKVLGLRIVRWTVFSGLAFFAVLVLERLVVAV